MPKRPSAAEYGDAMAAEVAIVKEITLVLDRMSTNI